MTNIQENWLPIKGFEGRYEISDLGRIKSLNGKYNEPHIYLGNIDTAGYRAFSLRFKEKGIKRKCVRVHQLVGDHFLIKPKTTERLEMDHIDCDRANNNVSNLRWVTSIQHSKISVEKGELDIKGEKHPHAKLTEKQVIKIRKLYATGNYYHRQIASMFNVSRRQVGDIINGKNWGWL